MRRGRSLASTTAALNVEVLLSLALTATEPGRRLISVLEGGGAQVDVVFRQPLEWAQGTAALVVPGLHLAYLSPAVLAAAGPTAQRDALTSLKELLFHGGHIILTAPLDPRHLTDLADLATALTNTSLVCAGEALAGEALGPSDATADAPAGFSQRMLPDVPGQVLPLSCNFPDDTVVHYRSRDGRYPTVLEWPRPLGASMSRGSLWMLGFTFDSDSQPWNNLVLDIMDVAGTTLTTGLVYPSSNRRSPPPRPPTRIRPPPPAWSSWSAASDASWWTLISSPPPPPPRAAAPPPPPAASQRPCPAAKLVHGQYGTPDTWYRNDRPLLHCSHELNVQLVVPQCLDAAVAYWDAETGTQRLSPTDYSANCSSPCLTDVSDMYFMHGTTESQAVYDSSAAGCPAVNRTRRCSDGEFSAWTVAGAQYRTDPCDGMCRDDMYDIGARFLPGQTQVRMFFSSQYVPYGGTCASVAVGRVRTCSPGGQQSWSAWSTGPDHTECYVQCPPPADGEVVSSYGPSANVLGLGAVLNRTMYGSRVADESGLCPSKVLQRTCGEPKCTRIRHETPLQRLAQHYGEVRLSWLPSAPWAALDPDYPHTACHASCRAPDGRFVPHGTSYSYLMYATGADLASLPKEAPKPPGPSSSTKHSPPPAQATAAARSPPPPPPLVRPPPPAPPPLIRSPPPPQPWYLNFGRRSLEGTEGEESGMVAEHTDTEQRKAAAWRRRHLATAARLAARRRRSAIGVTNADGGAAEARRSLHAAMRRASSRKAVRQGADVQTRTQDHHALYDMSMLSLAMLYDVNNTDLEPAPSPAPSPSSNPGAPASKAAANTPSEASQSPATPAKARRQRQHKAGGGGETEPDRAHFWFFGDYDYDSEGDYGGNGDYGWVDYLSTGDNEWGSGDYGDYEDDGLSWGDVFGLVSELTDWFDETFWGDYEDSSSSPGSDLWSLSDWWSSVFGGTPSSDFGTSASYYKGSCYAKSVNVYSVCLDGKLSSQWLDAGGTMQRNLTGLSAVCKQACGGSSAVTGQDRWYRYYYTAREADSRYDTYDTCAYKKDYRSCHAVSPPNGTTATSVGPMPAAASPWLMFDSMAQEAASNGSEPRYAVCGKTCAPDCAQSMVADGRPDPACNYRSCCFDGADYEVWMVDRVTTAQRLALLNTDDAVQEAVRQLSEVCNLQKAYDRDRSFGDDLQRLLVVAACRLQLSLYGGSDVTGIAVPSITLDTRSEFASSVQQGLALLRQLEDAMDAAAASAESHTQLLQQYFHRNADDPTNWAALQPTAHGSALSEGDSALQARLDAVVGATRKSDLMSLVLQKETRDNLQMLAATDLQVEQVRGRRGVAEAGAEAAGHAKMLRNRVLRSPLLQEALLTSPSGLLLLAAGKQLPDARGSSSFAIMEEWARGDVTLYRLPAAGSAGSGSGSSLTAVTGPLPPSANASRGAHANANGSSAAATQYAHFISLRMGRDNATGQNVFVLRGLPASGRTASPVERAAIKEGDGVDYVGSHMVHRTSGMILLPSGDRVLLQRGDLETVIVGKVKQGPDAFKAARDSLMSIGQSMVFGSAWDLNGDGLMAVGEVWAFLEQTHLVTDLGRAVWEEWLQAMYDGVWGKGLNATYGGLLDGYYHPEEVGYAAVEGVAQLLRLAVGAGEVTHSFWGSDMWDADLDGRVSQGDVLRTLGPMGLLQGEGRALVQAFYSNYSAGAAAANTTTSGASAPSGRRSVRAFARCAPTSTTSGSTTSGSTGTTSGGTTSGGTTSGGTSSTSGSTSNTGGSGSSSSGGTSKPESSWDSGMDRVSRVSGAVDTVGWVAEKLGGFLGDEADEGTAALLQATSTVAEAGGVLSDCAEGAAGALRTGWLGVVGAAANCIGAAAEAYIPGPVGEVVSFVANTVSTAVDIVTAPARVVADLAWEGVKSVGSAVVDFLSGWWGHRRSLADDSSSPCAAGGSGNTSSSGLVSQLAGLFKEDENGPKTSGAAKDVAAPLFDWLLTDDSFEQATGFGGLGSGDMDFFSFALGDVSDSDYSFLDILYGNGDYTGDYSSWFSTSSLDDYFSGLFDAMFDYDYDYSLFGSPFGSDYDYGYSGDYSGDYEDDYGGWFSSGGGGGGGEGGSSGGDEEDYDYGLFSIFGHRRAQLEGGPGANNDTAATPAARSSSIKRGERAGRPGASQSTTKPAEAVAAEEEENEGKAGEARPAGRGREANGPAEARRRALNACARRLLSLPQDQVTTCLRLLHAAAARIEAAAEASTPLDPDTTAPSEAADGEADDTIAADSSAQVTDAHRDSAAAHLALAVARKCMRLEAGAAGDEAEEQSDEQQREAPSVLCSVLRSSLRARLQLQPSAEAVAPLESSTPLASDRASFAVTASKLGAAAEGLATSLGFDGSPAVVTITPVDDASSDIVQQRQRQPRPKDPVALPLRTLPHERRRQHQQRRRLAAAAASVADGARSEVQTKLAQYDKTLQEIQRVAQVGFTHRADSAPSVAAHRSASLNAFLRSHKRPPAARKAAASSHNAAAKPAAAGGDGDSEAGGTPAPEGSLAEALGWSLEQAGDVQRSSKAVRLLKPWSQHVAAAGKVRGGAAKNKASKPTGEDGGAGGGVAVGGGLQSYMTQRFWGSAAERAAGDKAAAQGRRAGKALASSTPPSPTQPGSPSPGGTSASPSLGPDVPTPAISLTDIDEESNTGDGAAGRPEDPLQALVSPFLGPSFEGSGRGLAAMTRELWAALDGATSAQQVRTFSDLAVELQAQVAQAPTVCSAADLGATLSGTQDKPGQWAAMATLRGRGGAMLLTLYRQLVQTNLVRKLRKLALQYELSTGSRSGLIGLLDAAALNMTGMAEGEHVAGMLQQVYDQIKGAELAAMPEDPPAASGSGPRLPPASPPPPAPPAAPSPPGFGSNIAVSSRKTATVYFTLTSRTHAHVFANLSQGLAASIQVPMPRQTRYYDVRMSGAAVRVLADTSDPVTVQHRSQAAASANHEFQDSKGADMLRACASALPLPSEDAHVAAAVKGPISLFYPDPVSALSGHAVSYNHPVPAAFCNVFCPAAASSMGSYVTNGSVKGASALFSPYGSWLVSYRPKAGQPGFVKYAPPSGAGANTTSFDCFSTPCTFFRAEALQFEFNITYREVTDAAFLGTESASFFGNPAGDAASSLAAGLAAASPPNADPFLPATRLADERTPLADVCAYRTASNPKRPVKALHDAYSTATAASLAARGSSGGAYASFSGAFSSEPASQINVSVVMQLTGVSLAALGSWRDGVFVPSGDLGRDMVAAVRAFLMNGPAGVGQVNLTSAKSAASTSRRRRSLLGRLLGGGSTTAATDAGPALLEPLAHVRADHWHAAPASHASGTGPNLASGAHATISSASLSRRRGLSEQAPSTSNAGGVEHEEAVVGPARFVYRRRRQLQAGSGEAVAVTFRGSGMDVITGNQAAGVLSNGNRTNAGLESALRAYGFDAKVQVMSVSTGNATVDDAPPEEGDGGLSGGAIAGIVIGCVAGVALVVVVVIIIVKKRRSSRVAGAPW
ncbi:hypothetical protein HYH03_005322 [Edaphochlamys debaryana]|uniref:Uncharacterized protein n=1 Tax=Edaphochlamys debaryana TaxID=47281 RepID=A0A836C258_9CHLO|nr:hypothetical protein HYH03_005322 [Edaphochlamys debaryana]|eukprot:KAG2496497.1 hypothetical protein HYH03_005322 [Edaphochlamys debaryana]